MERFVGLLLTWQPRINLIANSTVPDVWSRHVADSLQLVPLLGMPRVIADLGSGGGFPGLVLACCGYEVHLYESNGKKAAFLREALMAVGGRGKVHHTRLEALGSDLPPATAVTGRALAPLKELLAYAKPFLAAGATGFFHKGEGVDIELTDAAKYWKFSVEKHPSKTDSNAVILEVLEIKRID